MKIDELNNFDLRSDLENDYLGSNPIFKFEGYVGNRPHSENDDEFDDDDTWAINLVDSNDNVLEIYLYVSEFEYNQDVKILTEK